ncbi:MAG: hypothetical protein K2K25_03990 [Muribaculaceae bacterium]|nr:hypothetical protein [Muribaculaceae bacterium]
MTIVFPSYVQGTNRRPTSKSIILDSHPTNDRSNQPVHRAPMHISVEAWYDALSESITIIYDGEASGEVFLYHDGVLIESSTDINTTFIVTESGNYAIEINTEYWTATGSIDI